MNHNLERINLNEIIGCVLTKDVMNNQDRYTIIAITNPFENK